MYQYQDQPMELEFCKKKGKRFQFNIIEDGEKVAKIVYTSQISYINDICTKIYDNVILRANREVPIAFDAEWPVHFKRGQPQYPIAVIQIAVQQSLCYVFSIEEDSFPDALGLLLNSDRVQLVGFNVSHDIRKLERDFGGFDMESMLDDSIDIGKVWKALYGYRGNISLKELTRIVLNIDLSIKIPEITRSNWDLIPLTVPQICYAATDVYTSLKIFNTLKKHEDYYDMFGDIFGRLLD